VSQAKIAKKFIKNSYFEGLWSFKVIDVDKSKKLVTSACYDMQQVSTGPIYNNFHTIRANNGKITTVRGVPLFDALVRGEPLHPGAQHFVTKN